MQQKRAYECPLCKNKESQKKFTAVNRHGRHLLDKKDTFNVLSCPDCEAVFIEKRDIDESYYKKYYQKGYYREE
ncbi:MAG: hypothetical protein V2A57_02420, partial [Elusimicrobiota bacterium]